MNNQTGITAGDVVAWLFTHADKLAAQTGIGYSMLRVEVNAKYHDAEWCAYCDGGDHQRAATMEEAIAKQVFAMAPAALAERKRSAAAQLIAEADALDAGRELTPIRDEPDYDAPKPLTALENWQRNDEHNVR